MFECVLCTISGTFGQPQPWDVYNPSTFQHPMVPYDVLVDPLSLPSHPMIQEKQNMQQVLFGGSAENISKDGKENEVIWNPLSSLPNTVWHKEL